MDRSQLLQILHSRHDAIADNWYQAVSRTGQISLDATDVRQRLVELTGQIIMLLATGPFEHSEAQAIGAALAHLFSAQPEALGQTQKSCCTVIAYVVKYELIYSEAIVWRV